MAVYSSFWSRMAGLYFRQLHSLLINHISRYLHISRDILGQFTVSLLNSPLRLDGHNGLLLLLNIHLKLNLQWAAAMEAAAVVEQLLLLQPLKGPIGLSQQIYRNV